MQVEGANGQTHPGVYSALRHTLTCYEHTTGDQDAAYAERMRTLKAQRAAANLAGEFVVTAIPSAPHGACAFEEFEYMEDPQAVREVSRCSAAIWLMRNHSDWSG